MADHVYLKPLTTKSIIEILKKHKVDAVLPTMGGQTALNLCIEADDKGIWEDFGVEIIGVDIDAIQITEDRDKFKQLMKDIDIPVAPAETGKLLPERKRNCTKVWFSTGYSSVVYSWRYRGVFCTRRYRF